MAQAERPASHDASYMGAEDYDAVRSLLERIAAALGVAIEDHWALPRQGLSIIGPDPALRRQHEASLAHYASLLAAARRAQATILPHEIRGGPGYDVLMESYIAWSEQRELSLSSACAATGVAPSLSLRWISLLVDQGLLDRTAGPTGSKNSFIRLTAKGVGMATRSLEVQQAYLPATR